MRGRHFLKRMRSETRSRQENLTELLARANHLLAEGFSAQLKEHGLSATEGRVLGALAERDEMPMTNLGHKVLLKQPTLTKVIDRMGTRAPSATPVVAGRSVPRARRSHRARTAIGSPSARECTRSGALGRWCTAKPICGNAERCWRRSSIGLRSRAGIATSHCRPKLGAHTHKEKLGARASLLSAVDQLISSAKEKPRHRRRGSFGGNASDVFCASLMPCRAPGAANRG
jgi:hypothetical protein